jgi:hypothetical protein
MHIPEYVIMYAIVKCWNRPDTIRRKTKQVIIDKIKNIGIVSKVKRLNK